MRKTESLNKSSPVSTSSVVIRLEYYSNVALSCSSDHKGTNRQMSSLILLKLFLFVPVSLDISVESSSQRPLELVLVWDHWRRYRGQVEMGGWHSTGRRVGSLHSQFTVMQIKPLSIWISFKIVSIDFGEDKKMHRWSGPITSYKTITELTYCHLKIIERIKSFLSKQDTENCVHAFVFSRLD